MPSGWMRCGAGTFRGATFGKRKHELYMQRSTIWLPAAYSSEKPMRRAIGTSSRRVPSGIITARLRSKTTATACRICAIRTSFRSASTGLQRSVLRTERRYGMMHSGTVCSFLGSPARRHLGRIRLSARTAWCWRRSRARRRLACFSAMVSGTWRMYTIAVGCCPRLAQREPTNAASRPRHGQNCYVGQKAIAAKQHIAGGLSVHVHDEVLAATVDASYDLVACRRI